MSETQPVVTFADFLATAPGQYLLDWEQRLLDNAVADIFGYHAMQLGMPQLDALRENRMPLRCIALDCASLQVSASPGMGAEEWRPGAAAASPALPGWAAPVLNGRREASLLARFDELPFASQSIDLVVLPHVLEFAQEPHRVLREVDRVLVPEGHLVLTGLNPASLWGVRHGMQRIFRRPFIPRSSQLIALPRIKDWLKLLSFEVNRGRFGCYAPCVRSESWIARWSFLEKAGDRWWPVLGSVYTLTAVKRVHGMRLVGLVKKRREERLAALQPATVAQRTEEAMTVRIGLPRDAANEPARHAVHG